MTAQDEEQKGSEDSNFALKPGRAISISIISITGHLFWGERRYLRPLGKGLGREARLQSRLGQRSHITNFEPSPLVTKAKDILGTFLTPLIRKA